ncbi:MAG: ATP-binding protein [Cyclobacteriaceae bacterium]|nr:ATP-binding protein [Cyclobacteriaceae bacterium]
MRKPSNPFIVTGYHSPSYFCDREEELAWLREQFLNERNSVLYSWRRMGKTALVRHFFYKLQKEKTADGVFVDLLGTVNLAEANKRTAQAILNRFGGLEKGLGTALKKLIGSIGATVGFDPLNGTPQITFGMTRGQSVSGSLEAIGEFLAERKKPVIICIDEFQQVSTYKESNAEATFRTWMQDFPMLRFIFCGSHRHMMLSIFSEESRPFYRSAQIRQLDPLLPEVYARFILSHFRKGGKRIDPPQLERIFGWTRQQTYYVQLVCNKLYGKTEKVEDDLVTEVFGEIIQQEIPLFSSYQQLFTAFQWKLMLAIAREEKVESPMSQHFLAQHGLGAASSVSAALQALVKKEFVIYQDQHYTLHDTLLLRWLQGL